MKNHVHKKLNKNHIDWWNIHWGPLAEHLVFKEVKIQTAFTMMNGG